MNLKDHLEKLEAFWFVAREKSFRRAADVLHIAQPSISRAVHMLEEASNGPLFVRHSNGVSLTPRGETLQAYCDRLFSEIKDLEARLQAPEEPMSGHLRVGTYESIAIYFWPKFLREFLARYPKMSFDLTTDRSANLFESLKANRLDLIVLVEPPPSRDFACLELYRDRFELYRAPGLATETVDRSLPVILMPDALSSNHETLSETLSRCGLHFERLFSTTSFETVKALTKEGVGYGLLPTRVASADAERGLLERVKGLPDSADCLGEHRICACFSADRRESIAYREFVASFKALVGSDGRAGA